MATLIAGATGATGRLLVEELVRLGTSVRAIVRSPDRLPAHLRDHEGVTVIEASILDLAPPALAAYAAGCRAVACCLGHNLSLSGLFGPPHRLVAGAIEGLCEAVRQSPSERPVRVLLMGSDGCTNRDLDEPMSIPQRLAVGLMRGLLPPYEDNVQAAEYLRTRVGPHDPRIQWSVVRPSNLIAGHADTGFEVHPSPIRNALFDPGTTSRLNVARFMAQLITDDRSWRAWRGRMPVIYDAADAD